MLAWVGVADGSSDAARRSVLTPLSIRHSGAEEAPGLQPGERPRAQCGRLRDAGLDLARGNKRGRACR